ncbi:extracellular solute-binding protein [Motilibacter aurantiacus]|uniref:extracellular solute-binding protein n=1 Tax=Motilibacter aurantiacus TaxID=2714955 RepID=UPI00140845C5|nr:extracellular solute-binding protein [Motilibacter aurantiacus]NHC44833.1 extracellular solute-binding protein [Motilibacter aurantiacus]
MGPGARTSRGHRGAGISRRRRRAPISILAVGAISAGLLTACGGETGPPTLTWYINPDSGGQAELARRCTEASGGRYSIETTLLPRDASSQREQLVRRLAANDSSIDLISLDPPFIPEFAEAGFLADIPEDVAAQVTEGVVDSAVEGATWNGKLVTVPFWANTQLLWYKKSAAEQAGLDMDRPVTWDQIIAAAKQNGSSIAAQGIRAESLTVWVNALVTSAGGQILENPEANPDDVTLGLETEAGQEAARVIQSIVDEGVAGPGLSNRNEDASATLFESDGADFMVNWPFVWPRAQGKVAEGAMTQEQLDDYGWTLYPAVVEGERSRPPYGGINLGVGAFSEHKDFVLEATQCITSTENQAYYFITNGNPAAKEAAYDDPEVLENFPQAPVIRESLQNAAPRPQTPYYNEVSVGIQRTWSPPEAVTPESTPEEATSLIQGVLRKEKLL